jgi:phosphoglycerate dehydrogenase-like enzyme
MSDEDLAAALLEAIVKNNLVNAVLDVTDAEQNAEPATSGR